MREILQEVDAELQVAALCKMQTGRALARLAELQTAADPKVRSDATAVLDSTVARLLEHVLDLNRLVRESAGQHDAN